MELLVQRECRQWLLLPCLHLEQPSACAAGPQTAAGQEQEQQQLASMMMLVPSGPSAWVLPKRVSLALGLTAAGLSLPWVEHRGMCSGDCGWLLLQGNTGAAAPAPARGLQGKSKKFLQPKY